MDNTYNTNNTNIGLLQSELTNLKTTLNLLIDKQNFILKQMDDARLDLHNIQSMFFSRSRAIMQNLLA